MRQNDFVWESQPKKANLLWIFVLPALALACGISAVEFFDQDKLKYAGVSGLIAVACIMGMYSVVLPSVIRLIQERPFTLISQEGISHGWRTRGWSGVTEVAYRLKEPTEMVFLAEGQKELFSISLSDGSNDDYDEAHIVASRIIHKIRSDAEAAEKQARPPSHWGDHTRGKF